MLKRFAFFQNAMLALLGSKDMQQGLVNLFNVLEKYMDIDALTFDRYEAERQSLVVNYLVTAQGFFHAGQELPLSADEAVYVSESENDPRQIFFDKSDLGRVVARRHAKSVEAFLPYRERRYMVSILRGENGVIGHLVCMGRGESGFAEEHAQMMEMLLPACSMVMDAMRRMQWIHQEHAHVLHERCRLQRELEVFTKGEMVGAQGGLRGVVEAVRQLADKDTPVLILGETGTGKELVANEVQRHSLREDKPFIKVNCGALSEPLVDSELFGHERGAFTGAIAARLGRFEQADGGTLFLDEVGELPLSAQVRLLRVLQDGIIERVGGQRPVRVDVRIIAATNRNLRAMCRQGTFRLDLFHRLNVFPIKLPPLRCRREDIPLLVRHLAERVAKRLKLPRPVVLMDHLDRLMQYNWPGNVRELENLVERGVIQAGGGPLDLGRMLGADFEPLPENEPFASVAGPVTWDQLDDYLDEKLRQWRHRQAGPEPQAAPAFGLHTPAPATAKPFGPAPFTQLPLTTSPLAQDQAASIRLALQACGGKVYGPGGAAELLGVNHNTLRSRMRKFGISTARVK